MPRPRYRPWPRLGRRPQRARQGRGLLLPALVGMGLALLVISRVDAALRRAGGSVYRLRVIHGYRGGTQLRDMLRREYGKHPKVKRLEVGLNPGATDLILREY